MKSKWKGGTQILLGPTVKDYYSYRRWSKKGAAHGEERRNEVGMSGEIGHV